MTIRPYINSFDIRFPPFETFYNFTALLRFFRFDSVIRAKHSWNEEDEEKTKTPAVGSQIQSLDFESGPK